MAILTNERLKAANSFELAITLTVSLPLRAKFLDSRDPVEIALRGGVKYPRATVNPLFCREKEKTNVSRGRGRLVCSKR